MPLVWEVNSFPGLLVRLIDLVLGTARVEPRSAVSLFLRHSFRDAFLGFSFKVVAQLIVEFVVRLRLAKQRPQPHRNRVQPMLSRILRPSLTRISERPSDRRASPAARG